MDYFILIRRDKTQLLCEVSARGETRVVKAVSTPAFLHLLTASLEGEQDQPLVNFPEGAKFYACRQEKEVIVIEQPPVKRITLWAGEGQFRSLTESYLLAFPYVIFFLAFTRSKEGIYTFDTLRVFYRTEPLVSEDDALSLSNLPNVYLERAAGKVCLGTQYRPPSFIDLKSGCEEVIGAFWQTVFSPANHRTGYDFLVCYEEGRKLDPRIGSLRAWAEASAEDPQFVLSIPWIPAGFTVKELVGLMLEERILLHFQELINIINRMESDNGDHS